MTRGENELQWLGTKRFWAAFGGVLFLGLLLFSYRSQNVGRTGAVVPVVALTGPEKVAAGGTARYAVLVRDRRGAPLPGAQVRIGFWKTGLVELARATTPTVISASSPSRCRATASRSSGTDLDRD